MRLRIRLFAILLLVLCMRMPIYAGVLCDGLFIPEKKVTAETITREGRKVEELKKMGQAYKNGRVSKAYARKIISELQPRLAQVELLPEVRIPEYIEFKSNLEAQINRFKEKLADTSSDVDFFELFEISLRGTRVFDLSIKHFLARQKMLEPTNEPIEIQRLNYLRRAVRTDGQRNPYTNSAIRATVEKLKQTLAENPEIKLLLSFETVNEIEIYHLLKKRIFILGLSDVPLSVDRTIYISSGFLLHDLSNHLEGFFGFSRKIAIFNRPGQVSDLDVAAAERRLQAFELKIQKFEMAALVLLKTGHVKQPASVAIFLYHMYHELTESVYESLHRDVLFRNDEVIERIFDFDKSIQHYQGAEVVADINTLLQLARATIRVD